MAPSFDSPPASPDLFSQPRPRPPRSPGHVAQIRTRNRRRAYLERHQSYFQSSEHELADPLLYDSLIRRFQTPAEREAEGRAKGYARVLEGSLMRGEERLAQLREQTTDARDREASPAAGAPLSSTSLPTTDTHPPNGVDTLQPEPEAEELESEPAEAETDPELLPTAPTTLNTTPQNTFLTPSPPTTQAAGQAQWHDFLRDRFIRGEDSDFEYAVVDNDSEYDVLERREREEAWFEEEEAAWVDSDDADGDVGSGGEEGGRVLEGETGVQDF